MKKSLFLILTILSIFLCMDNVNALSFNFNGKETEVNENNALDYLYSLAPDIFNLDIKNYLLSYDTTGSKNNLINFIYSSNNSCIYTTSSTQNNVISVDYPHLLSNTIPIYIKANCTHSWVRVSHEGNLITYRNNYNNSSLETSNFSSGNALLYSDIGIYGYPSTTFSDLKQKLNSTPIVPIKYTITYYINNEVYKTIEVEEGTSHELLTYEYNKDTHNFSGWTYDKTIDLTNITSDITITATLTEKEIIPTYTITYYLNNEIYKTIEVEEGKSHELLTYEYNKDTHNFSGWTYDKTIDLTNITSDITITATLTEKDVIPVYIDFPITKTEFYALLIEVGILIMMLFLKWCFPFKGGSDLK